ncbi:MAG: hypothetical protein ABI467_10380 [Kofleriaceae bacterium]
MGSWRISRRVGDAIGGLSPNAIAAFGFAAFVLYAYPGFMSTDSVNQLLEARHIAFSDGNPPLMSAEWMVLDRIISGPLLMLLLQGALFLGGLNALLRHFLSPARAAWVANAILLFPPVLATMAVIWKDAQMAAYLVAGIAAVLDRRRRVRVGGLVLLAVACALRHNAVAAVLPVVIILFEWNPGMRLRRRLAIVGVVVVLTIGAVLAVSRGLATTHVRITPMWNDIVGLIAYEDDLTDAEVREALPGVHLAIDHGLQVQARLLVAMRHGWLVMIGPERFFEVPENEAEWSAATSAWLALIKAHPAAYFAYHGDVFLHLLGADDDYLTGPVWNLFTESPQQATAIAHAASWSWLQHVVGFDVFYWLADHTPLFRPWIYAVIGLLLLITCCRDRVTFALLASGLGYQLSYFPIPVEPDCRYSHWMITSVVTAAAILFVQRWRSRS